MAIKHITHIGVYVADQDQALLWYTEKLGFVVRDDKSDYAPGFRWLTVSPKNDATVHIVLMQSKTQEERDKIGKNPMCVLSTDDCKTDVAKLEKQGVEIISPVEELPWGLSAVVSDLYGNNYNLLQVNI